jgi:hypothetical protein
MKDTSVSRGVMVYELLKKILKRRKIINDKVV